MKALFQHPASGILLIDKPTGLSSAQVVWQLKKTFQIKKIGHGGTLDPLATGLLPICFNEATKISSFLFDANKVYEGSMVLGIQTDTQDILGKTLSQLDPSLVSIEEIKKNMALMEGDQLQLPPMYSALKKNGKPLYYYARKKEEVERARRAIKIFSFMFLQYQNHEISFRVHCSKGTYVRTLCHDLGQSLGVGATLIRLKRTQTGPFIMDQAKNLDELTDQNLYSQPHWQALSKVFKNFTSVQVDESLSRRVRQGHWPLFREFEKPSKLILSKQSYLLDNFDRPLALIEPIHQRQVFKLVRVFNEGS